MKTNRVIVIVLDGLGVGALPDAAAYADKGANTLDHVLRKLDKPALPHLQKLGLWELLPQRAGRRAVTPLGCYGRMAERSRGKDSPTGHWEMMGLITRRPLPTYPKGFPQTLIRRFEKNIGTKVLGNCAASGTEIIQVLGEEHMHTGFPIVYTSVDSVFQIATHDEIVSVAKLYRLCAIARKLLSGPHAVGRVIARPFTGRPGHFQRLSSRKDFTLPPPAPTVLDRIRKNGGRTVGIGKTGDLFSNRGLSRVLHTRSNADGIGQTLDAIRTEKKAKLIFTNLVDTDMLFGHRNDCAGYFRCLRQFDSALPKLLAALRSSDVLIITSDHGCDPTMPGTDHTREYVPLLVTGKTLRRGINLGTRKTFADIGQTIVALLGYAAIKEGESFAHVLTSS